MTIFHGHRASIGHTRLTQINLLLGEVAQVLTSCGEPLTFIEDQIYDEISRTFHLHGTLRENLGDDRCGVSKVSTLFLNTFGSPGRIKSVTFYVILKL